MCGGGGTFILFLREKNLHSFNPLRNANQRFNQRRASAFSFQPASAEAAPSDKPAPVPLFVHSVDLRVGRGTRTTSAEQIFDLRVSVGSVWGTGEGTTWVPSNRFFIFSVFLCDFRVFRVMIRPSKRIPYTKSK